MIVGGREGIHSTSQSLSLSLFWPLCQPKSVEVIQRDSSPKESVTKLQGLCNFTVLSARRLGQWMKHDEKLRGYVVATCGYAWNMSPHQHLDAKYARKPI